MTKDENVHLILGDKPFEDRISLKKEKSECEAVLLRVANAVGAISVD